MLPDLRPPLLRMPEFSLKHFLLSVALIALGVGLVWVVLRPQRFEDWEPSGYLAATMWIVGGSLIGAGVMTPYKHPYIGAACGLVVQVVLMMIILESLARGLGGL